MGVTYILNFGHRLTEAVLEDLSPCVEVYTGYKSARIYDDPERIARGNVDMMAKLMQEKHGVALDGTVPISVVLPGYTEGAALVVAEIAGRIGSLPRVVPLRRRDDGTYGLFFFQDMKGMKGTKTKVTYLDLERVRNRARSQR